jgi:hypothetical protein
MKKETLWLVLIYFAAHTPLLFLTGFFHDDFVWLHGDPHLNNLEWLADGRPQFAWFMNFLLSFDHVVLCRIFTFVAYLMSGILFHQTLRSVPAIDPRARFFLTAFFMVFPADSTRITITWSYYSMCFLSFFLGFWLLARYIDSKNVLLRLSALLAFAVSFGLPSFLVLFGLVPIYLVYQGRLQIDSLRSLAVSLMRHADFLVLPVAFWAIRQWLSPPSGPFAGYFALRADSLGPLGWLRTVRSAIVRPILYAVYPLDVLQLSAIVIMGFLLYTVWKRSFSDATQDRRTEQILFMVGVVAFVLGVFPYLAVSKMPDYWDWNSRHALLVPLGVGFMLYYGLAMMSRALRVRPDVFFGLLCLLVSLFVTSYVRIYSWYWLDWYKCCSLVQEFQKSDAIRDHTSFLVDDEAKQLNAKRRSIRFYEYAGLMKRAFRDQTRFATAVESWHGEESMKELQSLLSGQHIKPRVPDYAKLYCLADWSPKQPEYLLRITQAREAPGPVGLVRLKILEFLDRTRFDAEISGLVHVTSARIAR